MTMFDSDISRGTRIVQIVGGFVVLAILAGIITFMGIGWNNAANDARGSQAAYREQVAKTETLQNEYNKLYKEYQQATGKKPQAASPEDVKQIAGQPGAKGDSGDRGLPGLPGIPGINGQNATDAQVAGAVTDYCAAHGGCMGATGQAGSAGANGVDGQNATDAQVAAAIQAYCDSHNSCKGDPGANGANGTNGVDGQPGPPGPGRGIQSIECQGVDATSSWVITYTDGTTSQTAGPCRISLVP